MSAAPRVTIVMPVFNGARFVRQAIASVQRQHGVDFEVLLHDDGSTDATPDVLQTLAAADPRLGLSRGENSGAARSRNVALSRARGDYLAFLDHDDLWPDGRLARQVAILDHAPTAAGVLGETLIFERLDANGSPVSSARSRRVRAGLLQAGLFRRSAISATGLFDAAFAVADDFDFLLRLIETGGPIEIDPEISVWYRLHPEQWTADLRVTGQYTARALAHSLRRRRAAAAAVEDDRPAAP